MCVCVCVCVCVRARVCVPKVQVYTLLPGLFVLWLYRMEWLATAASVRLVGQEQGAKQTSTTV